MRRNLVVFFVLITSQFSLAGGADIGGGLGLVCFNNQRAADQVIQQRGQVTDELLSQVTSVTPIDLIEAQRLAAEREAGLVTDRSIHETANQVSTRVLYHIEKSIPELTRKIRGVRGAVKEIYSVRPLELMVDAQLPDKWNHRNECALVTLAVQNSRQITFDRRLYERMTGAEKVALKLHEFLYYIGRRNGHRHSAATRFLIAQLLRPDLFEIRESVRQFLVDQHFMKSSELKTLTSAE